MQCDNFICFNLGDCSMKKQQLILLTFIAALLAGTVYGQSFKYPINIKYRFGFIPKTITTAALDRWYKNFKSNNLMPECNGGLRTISENKDETLVESMGWAMIIAAYMGDRTNFDGLYKYYKSKIQGHGMMAWKTSCNGVNDAGSASDGDLDVAFSLVVATWQWGESYKSEATKAITTVKKLIVDCSGTSVVAGGMSGNSVYGGCQETDISYYSPAFFRCFADFTNDKAWTKLADDTYTVLNNGANKSTGLVPDWQTLSGGTAGSRKHAYSFDASRVPWRIALDYLWNGNEKAKTWCKTISGWANTIGPKNIKDGYNLDGSVTGTNHNMSFVGGFAVAAMCNSQEIADAFGSEVSKMNFDSFWYHGFLGNCYMLAMTGNMWQIKDTGLAVKVSTCSDQYIESNGTVVVKTLKNHQIELSGVSEGNSVTLTTLQGQLAKKSAMSKKQQFLFDVSSLKSGCYILTINDELNKTNKRQIVSIY
jgi:endo-1,4-beta-D-glucanase Y